MFLPLILALALQAVPPGIPLPPPPPPPPPPRPYKVLEIGNRSCLDWITAHSSQPPTVMTSQLDSWLFGFLTGANAFRPEPLEELVFPENGYIYVDQITKYCRNDKDKTVGFIAVQVFDGMIGEVVSRKRLEDERKRRLEKALSGSP